jgi:hypothetical protein
MATVVGNYELHQNSGVYPSITIGEIKIERNLRERRKMSVDTHTDTLKEEDVDKSVGVESKVKVSVVCCVCGRKGYAVGNDGKESKAYCLRHFDKSKCVGWKVI